MPVHDAADLPTVEYAAGPAGSSPRGFGDVISQTNGEQVSCVEVAVAIVEQAIVGVRQDRSAVLADFIQGVRPGISELRGKSAPGPEPENVLQRVVVGRANGVELQNIAEVRVGAIRVDVGNDIEFASLASDIANLKYADISEALLNLQVVVEEVGRAEVGADRVGSQALRICGRGAIGIGAGLNAGEDGCASKLRLPWPGTPVIATQAIRGDRGSTKRVALNAGRRSHGWAEIQERVQVDLVIVDAKSGAYDQVCPARRLICQAEARGEMIFTRFEERSAATLDHEACSWHKVGDVLVVAGHRPEVFVAQAVINIQLFGDLPRILEVSIEGVHAHKAFRVSNGNGGTADIAGAVVEGIARRHIACEEIGQRTEERIVSARRAASPRASSAVEYELTSPTAMVKLIDGGPTDFRSVTQLVRPHSVGHDVGYVPGEVAATFRRRKTNLFKSSGASAGGGRNDDIRSAQNGLALDGSVRA